MYLLVLFKLEVMSRVGAQQDEAFRDQDKIQKKDITSVKTNGSKTSNLFEKVGNITSTS